jgi:tripartite-type tricarboxylate transporter receptor subunit TctC
MLDTARKAIAALVCLLAGGWACAQATYPSHPVKINVGFAAGGGTDLLARHYARRLGEKLGQPFVVENKPGKGGVIAVQATLGAPADGYTIVMGTTGMAVDAALGESSYDWQRDLAPIALLAYSPNVLVVSEKSSMRSVADLVREAKARRVTFGSAGVSSSMHMSGELFKQMAGVDMTHVPYRSAPQAEQALMAGEVDVVFDNIAGAMSFIEAGRLRPLAVSGTARTPELPNVPTIDEAGLKGFETTGTFFLMAPAKAPAAVVARLESAVTEVSAEEDTRNVLRRMRMVPLGTGAASVSAYMRAEYAKWKALAAAGRLEANK